METRHVRLFRNGRNQAVRIPREFELPGSEALLSREGEVLLSREGEVLTLRAAKPRSLLTVLKSLAPLDGSLPEARDRAPERFEL